MINPFKWIWKKAGDPRLEAWIQRNRKTIIVWFVIFLLYYALVLGLFASFPGTPPPCTLCNVEVTK